MASNNAFETENADDTIATERALKNRTSNDSPNSAPNESTSFNVQLDTYFSDEKIPIPDQVSAKLLSLKFSRV